MTPLEALGLAGAAYLLLLARSAWRQGEIRQFLWSLTVVAAIVAAIGIAVATAVLLDA